MPNPSPSFDKPSLNNPGKYRQRNRARQQRFFLVCAGLLGCVLLIGGGVFYLWRTTQNKARNGHAIPVIIADGTPLKVKPENPGGYTVPHQDKEIYKAFKTQKKDGAQEELLQEAAEEPIDQELPKSNEVSLPSKQDSWKDVFNGLISKNATELESDFSGKNLSPFQPTSQTVYRTSFGSYPTKERAQKHLKRLMVLHKKVFKEFPLLVQEQMTEPLSFFVTAGPFASLDQAETFCHLLREQKTPCTAYETQEVQND